MGDSSIGTGRTGERGGRFIRVGWLGMVCVAVGAAVTTTMGQPGGPQAMPKDVQVTKNIEYARVGERSLKLDLYVPPHAKAVRLPLVIWVHGDSDPLVPPSQSEILHEALKKAGADSTLYIVQGGSHGGFSDLRVPLMVLNFFSKHLQAAPAVATAPASAPAGNGRS